MADETLRLPDTPFKAVFDLGPRLAAKFPLPESLENIRFAGTEKISAVSAIDLHVIGSCSECEGAAAT